MHIRVFALGAFEDMAMSLDQILFNCRVARLSVRALAVEGHE
jgi:hypothetical protein